MQKVDGLFFGPPCAVLAALCYCNFLVSCNFEVILAAFCYRYCLLIVIYWR